MSFVNTASHERLNLQGWSQVDGQIPSFTNSTGDGDCSHVLTQCHNFTSVEGGSLSRMQLSCKQHSSCWFVWMTNIPS